MAKAIGWCLSSSILWLASNGKVFFADLSIRINDELIQNVLHEKQVEADEI